MYSISLIFLYILYDLGLYYFFISHHIMFLILFIYTYYSSIIFMITEIYLFYDYILYAVSLCLMLFISHFRFLHLFLLTLEKYYMKMMYFYLSFGHLSFGFLVRFYHTILYIHYFIWLGLKDYNY